MNYWLGLTARERALVLALGGILAALILYFGVARPLQDLHAASERALLDAENLAIEVRAAVRAAGASEETSSQEPPPPLRDEIVRTTRARGVPLSRMTPLSGGGLSLQIEAIDPEVLHAWLNELKETSQYAPRQVLVRRRDDGAVTAQLTFGNAG